MEIYGMLLHQKCNMWGM